MSLVHSSSIRAGGVAGRLRGRARRDGGRNDAGEKRCAKLHRMASHGPDFRTDSLSGEVRLAELSNKRHIHDHLEPRSALASGTSLAFARVEPRSQGFPMFSNRPAFAAISLACIAAAAGGGYLATRQSQASSAIAAPALMSPSSRDRRRSASRRAVTPSRGHANKDVTRGAPLKIELREADWQCHATHRVARRPG